MQDLKDNSLIICPNSEKIFLLEELNKQDQFYNLKFMTKEEFKNNYYFSYDEEALYYLMHKYHYHLDVCRHYLSYLYLIDTKKSYQNPKLQFLQSLKKELISNNLLTFNQHFQNYLSNKKIIVRGYYNLEKYEEELFNYQFSLPKCSLKTPVTICQTIEEEVNYVCLEIIKLLNKNIPLTKIYLTNISDDYLYTLKKIFSYYHLPLNIDLKESIYATKVVSNYLKDETLELENKNFKALNKKLVNVLNSLAHLPSKTPEYNAILIDKLKSTYLSPIKLTNAINIKELDYPFQDDDYVFVLGFNQDFLPKTINDIDYLNDNDKKEVSLYPSTYINKRNKEVTIYLLSKIKNLFLSSKLSSSFRKYYPSSLIKELNLKTHNPPLDNYQYSNIYNKIRLGEKLDLYYLYGEKDQDLIKLNNTYDIKYKTYSNAFTGLNKNTYLENLAYPLRLSYTSLNTYNECQFKYYLKNVLKLEEYSDTFQSFIGSMYHKILSLYRKTNFNLEEEYQKYLEKRDLSLKEKILLVRIKKDLLTLISILQKQDLLTGYNSNYYEKEIKIKIRKDIDVELVGYIDKIMFYQKVDDTYFAIVDYKSGTIDTKIEPMKYGLHMQLPIYLYLLNYGNVFSNPIFTGIYYQNILFNYPTWSLKYEKEEQEKYFLQGYSTDKPSLLERFDSTYKESSLIKNLSYDEDKGFNRFTKLINDDTLYNLVKFTKKHIAEKTNAIINAEFAINPKIYDKKNISCQYCTFKDICYVTDTNLTYLDKVDDLSFLGGEN